MILPSDSDLPPERNDDSNPDLPDDVTAWWEDPALADGEDETDDDAESAGDEDVSFLGDPENDEDLPPVVGGSILKGFELILLLLQVSGEVRDGLLHLALVLLGQLHRALAVIIGFLLELDVLLIEGKQLDVQ